MMIAPITIIAIQPLDLRANLMLICKIRCLTSFSILFKHDLHTYASPQCLQNTAPHTWHKLGWGPITLRGTDTIL